MTTVAGEQAGALLSVPAGRSSSLGSRSARLPAAVLPALRRLAYAGGRVLERDGLAVLALGEAAAIELPGGLAATGAAAAAEQLLAALCEPGGTAAAAGGGRTRTGAAAIALGALPFAPTAAARLTVPALAVIERAGEEPVGVAVGTPAELEQAWRRFPFDEAAPPPDRPPLRPSPDRFELASARPHSDFERLIAAALAAIADGPLEKVVCAREVTVTANRPFEQAHLLERLRALYPSCAAVAMDGLVGASPELLVRRQGALVTSRPLAGTVARSGDPEEDLRLAAGLLASAKERREHAYVVGAITAALAPLACAIETLEAPHLLELRNVSHLATTIRAHLLGPVGSSPIALDGGPAALPGGGPAALPGALQVVAALQPTPAVGGVPTAAALDFLAAHEHLERDRYAGPVGFVDGDGDGEFWLAIRSAMLDGRRARLLAGVGIVAGSDPTAELVETQLKLQALLAAAVRP